MLVPNQIIETKWHYQNKKYYETKGYIFTNYEDTLKVKFEDLPKATREKVEVICDYCGKQYCVNVSNYYRSIKKNGKIACEDCKSLKIGEIQRSKKKDVILNDFFKWCEEKGYKPITNSESYTNVSFLQYQCPLHGLKINTYRNMKNGHGCRECSLPIKSEKLKYTPEEVINIVNSKNNNELLNGSDYINVSTKNLKIKCGSCGNIFISSLNNQIKNEGRCFECGTKMRFRNALNNDEVEDIINSINNNILLNKEDYINNSTRNLHILCGQCGKNTFTTNIATYKAGKNMCDSCSLKMSRSERKIKSFLDFYNIPYIQEHRFQDCKDKRTLPFDFYLPDYNLCIEFDGIQHFEWQTGWCNEEIYNRCQKHDKIKNEYCKTHNIDLLRIPYTQANHIEEILKRKLDLDKINKVYPIMISKYRIKDCINI